MQRANENKNEPYRLKLNPTAKTRYEDKIKRSLLTTPADLHRRRRLASKPATVSSNRTVFRPHSFLLYCIGIIFYFNVFNRIHTCINANTFITYTYFCHSFPPENKSHYIFFIILKPYFCQSNQELLNLVNWTYLEYMRVSGSVVSFLLPPAHGQNNFFHAGKRQNDSPLVSFTARLSCERLLHFITQQVARILNIAFFPP